MESIFSMWLIVAAISGMLVLTWISLGGSLKPVAIGLIAFFYFSRTDSMEAYFAKKICPCLQPMMGLVNEMRAAQAANNMARVSEIGQQLQELQAQMTCLTDLEKEGKELEEKMTEEEKKTFEEKMRAELQKQCPDVAAMMNGGM